MADKAKTRATGAGITSEVRERLHQRIGERHQQLRTADEARAERRQRERPTDEDLYDRVLKGLSEVCADPSNPKFGEAAKLLTDLKGWKLRQPSAAERIDAIDPASVVQLIVTAVDANRPARDLLERFLPRAVTKPAQVSTE